MKTIPRILLFLFCFPACSALFAQNKIIGISPSGRYGDPNSGGMVWQVNTDGTGFQSLKNWQLSRLGQPSWNLVAGSDGKLYGMSWGANGDDQALFLFSIDPVDGTTEVRHIRDILPPSMAGLCNYGLAAPFFVGTDGYFYGVYSPDCQTCQIFRISPDGLTWDNISTMPYASLNFAGLQQMPDGILVAASQSYPASVYSGSPDGSGWKPVYAFFDDADSYLSHLWAAPDGYVYGSLELKSDSTRFFRIRPDGTGYSSFAVVKTGWVQDFIQGKNGSFFVLGQDNTTVCLWEIKPNDPGITALYCFQTGDRGIPIPHSLLQTASGDFCFYTYLPDQSRSLHLVSPDGATVQVSTPAGLKDASGYAVGKLTQMPDGTLFGYKFNYVAYPIAGIQGAVFSIQPDGTDFKHLQTLNESPLGGAIPSLLIRAKDGALYGVVTAGGQNGYGYVYKMAADGSGYQPVFQIPDNFSISSLSEGSNGQLYAGVRTIAPSGYKMLKIDAAGSGYLVLLDNAPSDQAPQEGPDGKLYWFQGIDLWRMEPDGTGKTLTGKVDHPALDLAEGWEATLRRRADGTTWGWIDFAFPIGCYDEDYGQALFTLNADGSAAAYSDAYGNSYNVNGKPMAGTDGFFYTVGRKFDMDNLGMGYLPNMEKCIKMLQVAGSDGWLYGSENRSGNLKPGDLVAYRPDDETCRVVIPAGQAGSQPAFRLEISASTATEQADRPDDFVISPNPAPEEIRVTATGIDAPFYWQIHDVSGRSLSSGMAHAGEWKIGLEKIPPGAYWLVLYEKDRPALLKPFIKN